MNQDEIARRLIEARGHLEAPTATLAEDEQVAEGGCGVIGLACDEQIEGRHLLRSLEQMRNRGNGKGGGVAAAGLNPEQFGVTQETLEQAYLVTIAYLDPDARQEIEAGILKDRYEIEHVHEIPLREDPELLERLETRPPDAVVYFVQPRPDALESFTSEHGLEDAPAGEAEDEYVYQTTYEVNRTFYASSTGDARAFVLSHGKDLLVLKAVAYADDVFRYYQLEDIHAHVWIGHHRYPTKGRVWHPGGAHPFIGLHEALVHNGDFANYHGVREVLAQRDIHPLFLTDTEVSVLVFDLLHRVYGYPLEYVIETLAPTTERDYEQLPPDKRRVYGALQRTHMHGSPDGPWFFLIAQSLPKRPKQDRVHRLLGITDTSMLRPQVFALQDAGKDAPSIGLAASEKQGIDAALASLAEADDRFWPRADKYWNARGGSHTDGGAFLFTVRHEDGEARLVCTDKFGREITIPQGKRPLPPKGETASASTPVPIGPDRGAQDTYQACISKLPGWDASEVDAFIEALLQAAQRDGTAGQERAFEVLTLLVDRRYATGHHRASSLRARFDAALDRLTEQIREAPGDGFVYTSAKDAAPTNLDPGTTVVVDASDFPPEGDQSLARRVQSLVREGARKLRVLGCRGHRFLGNGLGSLAENVRIDAYGSPGDYLASGMEDAELHVHGSAQDQLAQIMKGGTLVVHGDVGQAFMYGAEGGEAFVRGNAAGRPLINAVGRPRVVINGTALDYLGESFMAGDPLDGGGFVVLNGISFDDEGGLVELDEPYPGGNLFSLASGGTCYVRDPHRVVGVDQLNGGEFAPFTPDDWRVVEPMLERNAALFDIPVRRLLTVGDEPREPAEVYRKVQPGDVEALQAEAAWVTEEN